jgi:hypothetical protein
MQLTDEFTFTVDGELTTAAVGAALAGVADMLIKSEIGQRLATVDELAIHLISDTMPPPPMTEGSRTYHVGGKIRVEVKGTPR